MGEQTKRLHYSDCPTNFDNGAVCNCGHRYEVIQIMKSESMTWGWASESDGGALAAAARKHPETLRVEVRDRVDGGIATEFRRPQ